MKPLNRRLLIEIINKEAQQGSFFVPVEDKVEEFQTAKVVSTAEDCSLDLTGKKVIFHAYGIEKVRTGGKNYIFIGENHLICVE